MILLALAESPLNLGQTPSPLLPSSTTSFHMIRWPGTNTCTILSPLFSPPELFPSPRSFISYDRIIISYSTTDGPLVFPLTNQKRWKRSKPVRLLSLRSFTKPNYTFRCVVVDIPFCETDTHCDEIQSCEKYGISRAELLATPESLANIAYNRFVLDTSMRGDQLDLRVVTAPCLIGYGEVGKRLLNATEGVDKSDKNPYWSWIEDYGGVGFQGAVTAGIRESYLYLASIVSSSIRSTGKARLTMREDWA